MTDKQTDDPGVDPDELAEIEAIEARLLGVHARLATLTQMLADGKPLGGALVGRHGPYSEEAAQEFAALVNAHDGADGPLWDAIRAAGFEIVELPESLYGALTPETR
jgi:hypothetical protein